MLSFIPLRTCSCSLRAHECEMPLGCMLADSVHRKILTQETSSQLSLSTKVSTMLTVLQETGNNFSAEEMLWGSFPPFPCLPQEHPAPITAVISYILAHSELYYILIIENYECFDLETIR